VPPLSIVQVCAFTSDKSNTGAMRALLLSVDTWYRRRVAVVACDCGVWKT